MGLKKTLEWMVGSMLCAAVVSCNAGFKEDYAPPNDDSRQVSRSRYLTKANQDSHPQKNAKRWRISIGCLPFESVREREFEELALSPEVKEIAAFYKNDDESIENLYGILYRAFDTEHNETIIPETIKCLRLNTGKEKIKGISALYDAASLFRLHNCSDDDTRLRTEARNCASERITFGHIHRKSERYIQDFEVKMCGYAGCSGTESFNEKRCSCLVLPLNTLL